MNDISPVRQRLVLLPVSEPPLPWVAEVVHRINEDAYDHGDYDRMRAAVAWIADLAQRLLEMAATAEDPEGFEEAADHCRAAASAITDAAWCWDRDREDREERDAHGNRCDARRASKENW